MKIVDIRTGYVTEVYGIIRSANAGWTPAERKTKMADKFFTQKNCDRCGADLAGGRTMSMFNEQCICLSCADAERRRPDYEAAREAERAAVAAGDRNFKGVGL